tara:strand:- start:522 stop:1115 length:594 start_codon:yes stop_codon:yes gene_type:complete
METLKLTKTIYGLTKAHENLDEEFVEFAPKKHTINDLFDMYNLLFYDIIKEGKKHSHFNIIQESIRYAGYPINPKETNIEELRAQIQQIEDDIWSIENEHPFFKNGTVLENNGNQYYMHSGRRREINSKSALELIKRRAGKKGVPTVEFVILVSQTCIGGILVGPPINGTEDLNIDLMTINRFDDRQFDDLEENPLS